MPGRGRGCSGLFGDAATSSMDQVQLNQTFFKILALCHDTIQSLRRGKSCPPPSR